MRGQKTSEHTRRLLVISLIFRLKGQFMRKQTSARSSLDDVKLTSMRRMRSRRYTRPQTTSFYRTFSLMTPWKKGSKIIVFHHQVGLPVFASSINTREPVVPYCF